MPYNAYYAEIVAMLAFVALGIRLCRTGMRTRGLPERYLSAAFLLWALGYALWDLPLLFTDREWLLARCSFGGRVTINFGTLALALFIRSVFRPRERWASCFAAAIAFGLIGGVAGSAWAGDWLGERPFEYTWYWIELAANVAPSAWMAVEGMIWYGNARRRRRLGLCDPMSCNRFLLWGIAGVFWAGLEIVSFAQELEFALSGGWSELSDLLMGACEFVPAMLVWLAFYPPVAYRAWLERAADSERAKLRRG